jgi:ribosomal protein L11 methyltransferase
MKAPAQFVKLELSSIPDSSVDDISEYLFENKAQGVSEKLNFIQTSLQYDPRVLEKDFVDLEVFYNLSDRESLEASISTEPLSLYSPKIIIEKNKDWLEEWKKHYSSFKVEGDLWVYPSWEAASVKPDQLALLVDPGLAFGTGTHATTDLCMRALYKLLIGDHGYTSALDMGAGTGILSVLMKKTSVSKVLACEIDEMARDKCRENLELNSVMDVSVVGPEDLDASTYSLVVANIIDGVLLKLREQLYAATEKTLILSGILVENEENVTSEFLKLGFKLESRSAKEEWICLILSKA